ncbi:ABC-type nitrate/sulfonate/bicarbonate transport system substrate-binding protein [Motilibacter rhizosphaerae]|uniref:ABC-type nitrate/sulfonate/bicarbonate transport system substrate-binding protein n=1 Tax=Motilibacter rhizosphaerae TaxID=598652 RepID=A0A4Q7NFV1_9ACTN|nr:ABC transporter substrate-binding protein [Motilibacter rhizosphaerae]RZS82797.1 ABC-type nitrate/sulfonate/bicarbonate transport system substrate-binding protein [Motilibacter rhizosphaerae]
MRTKTLLPLVASLALVLGATTACGSGEQKASASSSGSDSTVELRYQGWANQVTLPELAEALGYLKGVKLKYVGNTISGPQDIGAAAAGQVDFGGAFDGAVAKLIRSGSPVKAVIAYYGSDKGAYNGFYVLDSSKIRTAKDLVGKKVGVNTLGGHNEAVLDTYLLKNGLTWDQVKSVQLVPLPPPNTDQALRAHQIDVAALTGQFREQTLAKGGVRAVFSDSQYFGDFSAGTYIFRKDFIAKHPAAVKAFTAGVAKAIEWTKSTPHDQVIAEYTKIIEGRKRNETTSSLKYWTSAGVATKGGVIQDSDFTRWGDWLEQTGSVKKADLDVKSLYTNEFNPYASGSAS